MPVDFDKFLYGPMLVGIGEDCIYTDSHGRSIEIQAAYSEIPVVYEQGETGLQTSQPQAQLRLSDLLYEPKVGDQLSIRKRFFRIAEIAADGQGGAVLELSEDRK